MTEPTPDQSQLDAVPPGPPRRTVLRAAAGVGAVGLLAACGGGGGGGDDDAAEAPESATTSGGQSPDATSPSGEASGGGQVLTSTSAVPVGSGVVLAGKKVVVTQPAAGQFKAFSAVCTHQACLVDKVDGKTISCPCHGSTYSVTDGSVMGGPAPRALSKVAVRVEGDQVVEA